jgi:kynurenine 3-monooxygenase
MSKVTIVGAGLAGSLLAIYLAKRGIDVSVFEARDDMRKTSVEAGRSINLALSDRGLAALHKVGISDQVLSEAVPMYGRMIHAVSGETKLLPYSGRKGEYINSVSRAGLNIALMNEAERYDGVRFHFDQRCVGFNASERELLFENGGTIRADTVIATDGAGSAVRNSFERTVPNFDIEQRLLEHGYKELHFPPAPNGGFVIDKNALHIWPRHQFMMIALPNFDGSFTCTLFLAKQGDNSFEEISRESTQIDADQIKDRRNPRESAAKSVLEFFKREFPDAVPLMPTLTEDFFHNPTGHLGTVRCWPWNIDGTALLLGDSAHAMVPFYGQGMNCAFEDVGVLDQLIELYGDDWETIFSEYSQRRKINTDAIQDMAEENFYEMRDATADPVFQRKRELETRLEQTYADYFSKYSMVTFREDLPYAVAKENGNAQDRLLMEICSKVSSVDDLDADSVISLVRGISKR